MDAFGLQRQCRYVGPAKSGGRRPAETRKPRARGWITTDETGKATHLAPGAKLAPGQIPWPTTWRFVIPEQTGVLARIEYQLYFIMPYTVKRVAMLQAYKETPVLVAGSDGSTTALR